jgi:hypothetical protein
MLVGLLLAVRRGGLFLPVVAYVLYSVASKAAVFAGIRLRMQVEPFLILFAALALVALAERLASVLRASAHANAQAAPARPPA